MKRILNLFSAACLLGATSVLAADKVSMGFIYVGPKDDYGYNQAHSEGAGGVQKLTWVKAVEEASLSGLKRDQLKKFAQDYLASQKKTRPKPASTTRAAVP